MKLDLNFNLVLQDTLRTILLLFCSSRFTHCCSLLGLCILLRKILFELGFQRCLLFLVNLFMINVLELDYIFGILWYWRCLCSFSVSACRECFAVGLQLFSESSNADLVVSCNTSLNCVSNFADF